MTLSVRERLLIGGSGTLIGATLLTCGLVYVGARSALLGEFDRRLTAEAWSLAALVHYEQGDLHGAGGAPTGAPGMPMRGLLQIRTDGDRLVASSPGLAHPLPMTVNCIDRELVPGERWRIATVTFHPQLETAEEQGREAGETAEDEAREHGGVTRRNGPYLLRIGDGAGYYQDTLLPAAVASDEREVPQKLSLTLAMNAGAVDRELMNLLLVLITATVAVGLAGLVVLVYVARWACRPLLALADQVSAVPRPEMPWMEPLSLVRIPAELLPLAEGLNLLLARLRETLEREKAFSADIAHELRTPLTGMRSAIDVCLRRERAPEVYRLTLEESRRQCIRFQGMVSTLLELARLDAAGPAPGTAPLVSEIPLPPIILHVWEAFAERAVEQRVVFRCAADGVVVSADPERFERILANLFENAVTYCDPGGTIAVDAVATGTRVALRVANSGSRIAAADAERVFDRFWRGDRSAAAGTLHAGLGLCLCQRLVTLMGGRISATSVPGGEFAITIELPGRNGSSFRMEAQPVIAAGR